MSRFTADVYQNEFLALGDSDVDAIVTVSAVGAEPSAGPARIAAAELVIVDASGSMVSPTGKLKAAKQATGAAIDAIRDGVPFGVIAGTEQARAVFPISGTARPRVRRDPHTREGGGREHRALGGHRDRHVAACSHASSSRARQPGCATRSS